MKAVKTVTMTKRQFEAALKEAWWEGWYGALERTQQHVWSIKPGGEETFKVFMEDHNNFGVDK